MIDAARRASSDEENSRLAAIVTSSDAAIVGEALDGTVTDWNRGAEAVFGYTAAEVIGKTLSLLLSDGQQDEALQIMERIKGGERIERHETQRRRKDNAIIDVSLTVSPVWDSAGRLFGHRRSPGTSPPRNGHRPRSRSGRRICGRFSTRCPMR